MKIGIFDSGMGGLSVLHLALRYLPNHQFIYYADEEHVPYGEKKQEDIIRYVDEIIQFMIDHGVEAIVIACNTATSAAIALMRKKYHLPIIGMEPAVKKAIDTYGDKRVLVIATPITVQGQKMHNLVNKVDKNHLVDLVALPELVRFAERLEFDSIHVKEYLKKELSHFSFDQYSSLVLGCTHFNYFKDSLRAILPQHIHFVDGNEGTIKHLMEYITPSNDNQTVEYYFSGKRVTQPQDIERIQQYLKHLDKMIKIQ